MQTTTMLPAGPAPSPTEAEPISRRTAANRLNAQKSTGPKSEEGKARSRRNGLKHGLSGGGVVLLDAVAEEARKRAEEWAEAIGPRDGIEVELVEMAANAMSRARQCWREEEAARRRAVMRAERAWETDRRAEVARLADRLAKDPGRTVAALRTSLQGAEWLADRWRELAIRIDAGRAWTDLQRSLALDLLGISPEFRDDLTPIDFPGLDPLETRSALWALVADEVATLQASIDEHLIALDDDDRSLLVDDLAVIDDPTVNRIKRYERSLSGRVLAILERLGRGPAKPDETKPTPEPEPAPAPIDRPEIPTTTPAAVDSRPDSSADRDAFRLPISIVPRAELREPVGRASAGFGGGVETKHGFRE